jgi:hypothetical protein
MIEPLKAMREFRKNDNLMIEQSQTMHGNFVEDISIFQAKAPYLTSEYAAEWQTDINTANTVISDTYLVDQLQVVTQDLMKIQDDARNHFQSLMFYVKRVFHDNKAIQNLFGLDKYRLVRNNTNRFIDLLQQAYRTCTNQKYQELIVIEGFSAENIEYLNTLAIDLHQKNIEQEDIKNQRPVSTQERIVLLNKSWKRMVEVNEASKIVFMDNYAKLQQYLLYPETGGNKAPMGIGALTGVISDESGNPLVNANISLSGTEYLTLSNGAGEFIFETVNTGVYGVVLSLDGFKSQIINDVEITDGQTTELSIVLETE